jgi:hypothetical protein
MDRQSDRFLMYWDETDAKLPYDVFEIDRFVRAVSNPATRRKLIDDFSDTPGLSEQYEQAHRLPTGAFELLHVLDDEQLQRFDCDIRERYKSGMDDVKQLEAIRRECDELTAQLRARYPRGFDFLEQYSRLVSRSTGGSSRGLADNLEPCQGVWLIGIAVIFVFAAGVVFVAAAQGVTVTVNVAANANGIANANAKAQGGG